MISTADQLDAIIDWIESDKAPAKFNSHTVYGIKNNYQEYHNFTERQETAINNIFTKFKIRRPIYKCRNSNAGYMNVFINPIALSTTL